MTVNIGPCSCVTTRDHPQGTISEPEAIIVVWTMEDFDVASYPLPKEKVVPFVLSASMVLLNLVWKSKEVNSGNAEPPPRSHKDLFH